MSRYRDSLWWCREQGSDDGQRKGERARRRGAEKVEDHLLVRLVQEVARDLAGNVGKKRRPGARGSFGEGEPGKERGGEVVWEVERSGVSLGVLARVLL
jgi:hypothetical protein